MPLDRQGEKPYAAARRNQFVNIIFIHGKESDPKNSSKAQEIQDRFPESIVSVPDYRPKERSFEEIDDFFKDYLDGFPSSITGCCI